MTHSPGEEPVKIYLGGPINGCTDAECRDWRTAARRMLEGHEIVDPMVRDYRSREDECVAEIVEADKADISGCDVLLMNCPKPSVGTSMEILLGWLLGKRVVCIAQGRISPWLRYHSRAIHPTLADAVADIRRAGVSPQSAGRGPDELDSRLGD